MKRMLIALCLAVFAVAAGAQNAASGVVKKVDAASGKVTIAHGPVPSLKWPAMTMGFVVKDKKLLDRMPMEKKIDFEFVQQGKDYVITRVN